jgi:DNA (cytosine-5)-methyltransferase 1
MSLGFEQAGFDISAAVEIDPIHACVHQFYFPSCRVLASSVTQVSGEDIRHAAGMDSRDIDVVFGGAPCQGFSMIGQRALDDPRNALVREFVRLVKQLKASYFVFENVKGLTVGQHRTSLNEVIEAFRGVGYQVLLPWQVLNAASYGVPQSRERLFLMGAKKGYPLPAYPAGITKVPGGSAELFELPESPTCGDALGDLPDPEQWDALLTDDAVRVASWPRGSRYAGELRADHASDWHFGYRRAWDRHLLTCSMRTEHSHISRRRFVLTAQGEIEAISRFFRLPRDGICNTLRAGTDAARGAFTSPRPIHYEQPRCITVREMARLHGFPDWFRFQKTKWHGARQIGNAVPPPLARHVAACILDAAGFRPSRPQTVIELGDERLLSFDMSQAARYWSVPIPIGRRDRKNGLRKRKQEDIERQANSAPEEQRNAAQAG